MKPSIKRFLVGVAGLLLFSAIASGLERDPRPLAITLAIVAIGIVVATIVANSLDL